jgi:cation diffusion facilitator CzcD-associated flavoprotein CzcO
MCTTASAIALTSVQLTCTRRERFMRATEVLVIGADPYGLSISTHLRGRGIDHLIVGRPMDTWRNYMPAGMYLKSEPFGSDMCDCYSTVLPGRALRSIT